MILVELGSADWYVSNWIFRQFAEDVVSAFPNEAQYRSLLSTASDYHRLDWSSLDQSTQAQLRTAFRYVAERIVRDRETGLISKSPEDTEGHQIYSRAVSQLLDLLQENSGQAS